MLDTLNSFQVQNNAGSNAVFICTTSRTHYLNKIETTRIDDTWKQNYLVFCLTSTSQM